MLSHQAQSVSILTARSHALPNTRQRSVCSISMRLHPANQLPSRHCLRLVVCIATLSRSNIVFACSKHAKASVLAGS